MSNLIDMNDEELMQLIQKGDFDAFEVLFNRHNKPLINFLYRYTNDFGKSEDLFQLVFQKVFEKRRTFKGDSSFKTWLYSIAVNSALDMLRKSKKEKGKVSLDLSASEHFPNIDLIAQVSNPAEVALSAELKHVLEKSLAEIPEEYRTPFILARFQDMSYKEIAITIGKTLATVRMRIHRAHKLLEAKMDKYLNPEETQPMPTREETRRISKKNPSHK
ncbi:MAG: sigma-70 family RNA polymerase sigma factor [Candidatus Heimdallarchaeota archaeon]|nr:sigma-70 family RNA polymerase sigma factor [Candidatus Heimdallarchaeota archaeon]